MLTSRFLKYNVMALTVLLTGLYAPQKANASEGNRFLVMQITVNNQQPVNPSAGSVLAQEVRFRSAVLVRLDRTVISLELPEVLDYPFWLWVGNEGFSKLNDTERKNLKTFIQNGGFLLIDNAGEGMGAAQFERAIRQELATSFPNAPLQQISSDHVLFRSFYEVSSVNGRRAKRNYLEGITIDGRLAVVYSHNDLTGAFAKDAVGEWQFEALPGGPKQREDAIKLGINIVMYALLLDYKDEQAHIEMLLNKRRINPKEPMPNRIIELDD